MIQGTEAMRGKRLRRKQYTHRLLTHEEELALGRRVRAGWPDVEAKIDSEAARDAIQARDELVLCNQRLVIGLTKQARYKSGYRNFNEHNFEDEMQAGNMGLLTAARKFDPAVGVRFNTYAAWWIRQALQRYFQSLAMIHIPEYLKREHGHTYLAGCESVKSETLSRITEYEELILANAVVRESRDRRESMDTRHLVEWACREANLSSRFAQVLRRRYGLDGPEESRRDIAQDLGVSWQRVLQIEQSATAKIRKALERSGSLRRAFETHFDVAI